MGAPQFTDVYELHAQPAPQIHLQLVCIECCLFYYAGSKLGARPNKGIGNLITSTRQQARMQHSLVINFCCLLAVRDSCALQAVPAHDDPAAINQQSIGTPLCGDAGPAQRSSHLRKPLIHCR